VALPKATTINPSVFVGCTSLISVSLPEATSIYDRAFQSCTALSDLYFQTTSPPTLYGGNGGPFYWTGPSGTLTIHVPSGMVSAYESVWGVAASTSAYGNPSVYGNNHKAIEIVD
jgi:hypothetical protein